MVGVMKKTDIKRLLGCPEGEREVFDREDYLHDRVVLVTGAGGSIGSELCRQISRCGPRQLILLGRGEHSIFQIQNELASSGPEQNIVSVIGDVGHPGKMDYVFRKYRPEIVFHAAAHKHVSFVEQNPEEGVLNNVFGTRNIARVARQYGAERFVLSSTDKAVAPISMLGATKKLAECLIRDLSREGSTRFVSVRFGNVLCSRGSVVPLFEEQIASGGPVTVTHADARRFFMSIPEAAHLVLHSGAVGKNGDLCVLDMGEPVRILDLAEALIQLNGQNPDAEIDIVFTRLGPGEKLVEQLLTEAEAQSARREGKILVCQFEERNGTLDEERLERLRQAAAACRRDEIMRLLKEMVPGYQPGASASCCST